MIHIYDETSNQAFFVNTTLLCKNYEDVCILGDEAEEGTRLRSYGWVDYVRLETPPVLVSIDTPSPLHTNEVHVPSS